MFPAWPTVQPWGSERLLIPEFSPMEPPPAPSAHFIMWPVWCDCECTTARSLAIGLCVQNENRASVHTAEQVNPCRVTCSPATSLFLSTARGEQCVICQQPQQPCCQSEVVQQSWGSNLDFWFRHHAGFLWCLHPVVGSSLSPPDSTLLNVYTILSQGASPFSLLTCYIQSFGLFVHYLLFFPFNFFFYHNMIQLSNGLKSTECAVFHHIFLFKFQIHGNKNKWVWTKWCNQYSFENGKFKVSAKMSNEGCLLLALVGCGTCLVHSCHLSARLC